jgi:hypothetical protein
MSEEKLNATISFTLPKTLKDRLVENAKQNNMNLSQYLRYLLDVHFKNIKNNE